MKKYKIAVAGTGYVGLSIAIWISLSLTIKLMELAKMKSIGSKIRKM